MKATLVAFLLVISAASVAHAQQYSSFGDLPQITVSGEAVVNVVPDKIIITLGIETWDRDMDNAKEKNNDILREALHAIRGAGVEDKNIQTDNLSIEPRYRDGYRKEDFLGYFVRNTLAVTLGDPARVDDLVSEVLDAGVNYIHGIDFQSTEYKQHREKAREMALLAAKEKAEKMAAVLGRTVGEPLQITEEHAGSPVGYWYGWGHGRASGMSQNVMQNIPSGGGDIIGTVALGKVAIRAGVRVTFRLTN